MTTLKEKISAKFEYDEKALWDFSQQPTKSSWTFSMMDEAARWQHNQLKNEVLPILLDMQKTLESISQGHITADVHFSRHGQIHKDEAYEALERLRKWSEDNG